MFRSYFKIVLVLILASLATACGSRHDQIGGIMGEVKFNTLACVPQQKIVNIRNDDTTNPQRVMGVYFELGTNETHNYKITKVMVGSTEYDAVASLAQEILIPAGGIMSIHSTYNPKTATNGNANISYLDVFLNGPKLGIMQIKMTGDAAPSAQTCTGGESFRVTAIHVTIKASPKIPTDFTYDIPEGELTKPLIITGTGDNRLVSPDNFPSFIIKGSAIPAINDGGIRVELSEDTSVTYDGTTFNTDAATLKAAGAISVTGKWTSSTSAANGTAPNTISLDGAALQDGKMKLAYTAVLQSDTLASYGLNGGVVGFVMELTKQ